VTDFGQREGGVGATAAKQDDVITKLEAIEAGLSDASAANQETQITAEEAIQAAVEALTKSIRVTPVDAQVFDDGLSEYTSDPMEASGYRMFLLRIILAVTGTPTTIKINVQFSQEGTTYENYVQGPFGSLMYEDTGGAKSECIGGFILGDKMKINVVATGVDAGNYFTLTCKVDGIR